MTLDDCDGCFVCVLVVDGCLLLVVVVFDVDDVIEWLIDIIPIALCDDVCDDDSNCFSLFVCCFDSIPIVLI
jgi:hypothetical protein